MTERQYLEKRYFLLNRMLIAQKYHCNRTAAARQRDIDRLDAEYNQNKT